MIIYQIRTMIGYISSLLCT